LGISLAGNLVKPLLSLHGTEWRDRGYGLRCLFPSCKFEFVAIFSYCLYFARFVCLLKRLQSAEIETGMAEKSSWDQANKWQKLDLVRRKEK
jgi:hypothetical protein